MQTPLNNSMQVSSKHFVDILETNIIQLARAYSVEFGVKVDPDAKKMTREVIQNKANQLLSEDETSGLRRLWNETVEILKSTKSNNDEVGRYARDVYEALMVAGFNNV